MAREKHIEKPVFRLATRLCIMCGCTVLFAIPFHQVPHVWSDDVLDEALKTHVCATVPTTRGTWSVRK